MASDPIAPTTQRMNLVKQTYCGSNTVVLDFKIPVRRDSLISNKIVIGGMVVCQFRVEVNYDDNGYSSATYTYRQANNYNDNTGKNTVITVSEKFDLADKSIDACFPVITSKCIGFDAAKQVNIQQVPHNSTDERLTVPTIWHYKGQLKYTQSNSEYSLRATIAIEDISIPPNIFSVLYEDAAFTDFELHASDGVISVHKAVLFASVPRLNTLLSGEWKETSQGKIELSDVSKATLADLKVFIYLRKLPDRPDKGNKEEVSRMYTKMQDFMKLACYLMMPDLIQCCTAQFLLDLSDENAYQLLSLGVMYNIKSLILGILSCFENKAINLTEIILNYQVDPYTAESVHNKPQLRKKNPKKLRSS